MEILNLVDIKLLMINYKQLYAKKLGNLSKIDGFLQEIKLAIMN